MTALELRGYPCGVELDDLVQSGYLALVKAVESYDPTASAFSSWLVYHLKTSFAEATGFRTKRGMLEPLNNSLSLDKTVDDESEGTPFGEFVPDPKAAATMLSIEEKLWRDQLHKALQEALNQVPATYKDVLHLRYWENLTLAEVGKQCGVCADRIRAIERQALRELRKPYYACKLRPFYTFDYFCGTGLGAYRSTGMSVQERHLVLEEELMERKEQRRQNRKDEWQRILEKSEELLAQIQCTAIEKEMVEDAYRLDGGSH